MEKGYWDLFWATGSPALYLLYRQEADFACEAKTAGAGLPAAEV